MDHPYRKPPLWISWLRDQRRHVTPNGRGRKPKMFQAQYLENRARYRVGVNHPLPIRFFGYFLPDDLKCK